MVSESQKRATKNFEEKAYFKTLVRFKKEDEARIRAAAGDSLNGFIVKCVLAAIDGQNTQCAASGNPDPIMDSLVTDADESRLQAPDWIQSCKTESEKRDALQAFIDAKRQEIAAAKKKTPGAVTEEDAEEQLKARFQELEEAEELNDYSDIYSPDEMPLEEIADELKEMEAVLIFKND